MDSSASLSVIKAIDRQTVHRICAGQVVVDLATAVKELVENSLDAEATVIEVKLKEMGAESFEVTDNGLGIRKGDYEGIARKHFTSKIEDFSDLNSVKSFGFRGEALNALNELSKVMVVTTKREDEQVGSQLTFERDGSLKSCKPIARGGKGTTVVVEKLFESLPVRRNEFVRNIKKQYAKLLKVLQSYAVVSTGVKFSIVNITGNNKQIVLSTQCANSMADNISSVFGSKFLNTLTKIELDCNDQYAKSQNQSSSNDRESIDVTSSAMDIVVDDDDDDVGNDDFVDKAMHDNVDDSDKEGENAEDFDKMSSAEVTEGNAYHDKEVLLRMNNNDLSNSSIKSNIVKFICETNISGYISKAGSGVGRSDNDRQFLFVNGRPVDLPRITKILNEVWRRYEMKHKPAFIVNISVPAGSFDVNLTPDKREVVLVHEKLIVDVLRNSIDEIYAPSRYTFAVSSTQPKFSFGQPQLLAVSQPQSQSQLKLASAASLDANIDVDDDDDDANGLNFCSDNNKNHVENTEQNTSMTSSAYTMSTQNSISQSQPDSESGFNRQLTKEEEALAEYDRLMNENFESPENADGDFVFVSNSLSHNSYTINEVVHNEWSEEENVPLSSEDNNVMRRKSSRLDGNNVSASTNSNADPLSSHISSSGRKINSNSNSNKERSLVGLGSKRSHRETDDGDDIDEIDTNSVVWATKNQSPIINTSQGKWSPHKVSSLGNIKNNNNSNNKSSSSNIRRDVKSSSKSSVQRSNRTLLRAGNNIEDFNIDANGDSDSEEEEEENEVDGFDEDEKVEDKNEVFDDDNDEANEEVVFVKNTPSKSSNFKTSNSSANGGSSAKQMVSMQVESFDKNLLVPLTAKENSSNNNIYSNINRSSSSDIDSKSNINSFNPVVHSNASWNFNPDQILLDFKSNIEQTRSKKMRLEELSSQSNKENIPALSSSSSEDLLSRMIKKQDFLDMKVLGQFNLGFMICELKGDLYILDQHACDEKYKFETLQQTTTIHQQPLISPLIVETNAAEEIVIIENLKIFEANGFKLSVDENEVPGSRIKLLSVPFSKSVQFNTDDVHELASLLSDESSNYVTKLILKNDINPNIGNSKNDKNMIRLPKLAAMFASRACRSAVMIGTALSNSEMKGIVDRLTTIEQPWNCPHGRPTMRHLFDLSNFFKNESKT